MEDVYGLHNVIDDIIKDKGAKDGNTGTEKVRTFFAMVHSNLFLFLTDCSLEIIC